MKSKNLVILSVACIVLIIACARLVYSSVANSPSTIIKNSLNPNLNYLIMVNDQHPYEFDGQYDQELAKSLIYPPDVYGEATPVEKATFTAFTELQHALAQKDMLIGLYSAYRTKEDQQYVYDYYGNLEGWSENNKVVKPGYSEHHTGLLLNILIWHQEESDETPIWYTETAERQAQISRFKLLHETLADYGFIDRYPSGKEDITNTPSEPYEIRFIGSPKVAHEIMDNGLTLEEYLAK